MKERIAEDDMYYSMDGRLLAKRLKKPREIKNIEAWIEEYDLARVEQMGDIDEVLARPEQQLVLTRYDGSTVTVTVKAGMATIQDSDYAGRFSMLEEDRLANIICRC